MQQQELVQQEEREEQERVQQEEREEQERVQQQEREEQERVQQREMYGRSCGAKVNPEKGWNPEAGSPYHHDQEGVEVGSDHH